MNVCASAKEALRLRFPGVADKRGYAHRAQENLLPGIDLATVEDDLRHGDGDELRMKFCAVHSSCALAINCFAPFKTDPGKVQLLEKQCATSVQFEHKLNIFRGGRAPNLDVWIEFEKDIVAVESKLLEYLSPKKPEFSPVYDRLAPPKSDPRWWRLYEEAKKGTKTHLDRAQLIKHYFGLNKFRQVRHDSPNLTLLYLFWEPTNWNEFVEFHKHRSEVEVFAKAVEDSPIKFRWMTYSELWNRWTAIPDLADHAIALKVRYEVSL